MVPSHEDFCMDMRLKLAQEFLDMANRDDSCAMDFPFFCLRSYNHERMTRVSHVPENRMRISIGSLFLLYFHRSGRSSRTRCIASQHGSKCLSYICLYGQESHHIQPIQGLYSGSKPPDLRMIDININEQTSPQLELWPGLHLSQLINRPSIINIHRSSEVSHHLFPASWKSRLTRMVKSGVS